MNRAVDLSKKYNTILKNAGINTSKRKAMFFAQLDHESGLRPIEENLRYSKERLLVVFPKYFNQVNVSNYAYQPESIANRVYGGRMGNGNESTGDGWKYRGRGFIQLTGKNNYKALSNDTDIDYLNNPDWLLREPDAMIAAIWFWTKNNLNSKADAGDINSSTKIINGGLIGLTDRKNKYNNYLKIF